MQKLTSSLVLISLLTSTLATTRSLKAEVLDPRLFPGVKQEMINAKLDPLEYLLIDEGTLRKMNKESKALPGCEKNLKLSQDELTLRVDQLNAANLDVFNLRQDNYQLKVDNFALANPPWYKSVAFWAPTAGGLALVAALTLTLVLSK